MDNAKLKPHRFYPATSVDQSLLTRVWDYLQRISKQDLYLSNGRYRFYCCKDFYNTSEGLGLPPHIAVSIDRGRGGEEDFDPGPSFAIINENGALMVAQRNDDADNALGSKGQFTQDEFRRILVQLADSK